MFNIFPARSCACSPRSSAGKLRSDSCASRKRFASHFHLLQHVTWSVDSSTCIFIRHAWFSCEKPFTNDVQSLTRIRPAHLRRPYADMASNRFGLIRSIHHPFTCGLGHQLQSLSESLVHAMCVFPITPHSWYSKTIYGMLTDAFTAEAWICRKKQAVRNRYPLFHILNTLWPVATCHWPRHSLPYRKVVIHQQIIALYASQIYSRIISRSIWILYNYCN